MFSQEHSKILACLTQMFGYLAIIIFRDFEDHIRMTQKCLAASAQNTDKVLVMVPIFVGFSD